MLPHCGVACTHTTHSRFLFNWPMFLGLLQVRLFQVRPVHESKLLGIVVAELYRPNAFPVAETNSIKALKDDTENTILPMKSWALLLLLIIV